MKYTFSVEGTDINGAPSRNIPVAVERPKACRSPGTREPVCLDKRRIVYTGEVLVYAITIL